LARNPFQQLYVGESLSPSEFTDIFSTALVKHAMPLFEPGHVVLTGTNGMGKTMLFKLFDPEVRLAYASAGKAFPVPDPAGRFIAATINVNTARCNDFGNRRAPEGENAQELMFGDFLNYFIVLDMLRSVETLAGNAATAAALGLRFDEETRRELTAALASDAVWEGYLDDVSDYEELRSRMERRLLLYRRFMNANDVVLNPQVATTKTSVGEPIRKAVIHLRNAGIVPADLPFFVVIDQYEELASINSPDGRKADYRSVVNKMLNSRDPTVSYRIGTRGYGWRNHLRIFGTDMRLEEERLFKKVELEARLRRTENANVSVFPEFARDVFRRRVKHAACRGGSIDENTGIADMFGRSMAPAEVARVLAGPNEESRKRIVVPEPDWPEPVTTFLKELAARDPLSAKLGEVWMRQKGVPEALDPERLPWEIKTYWKKERVEVALLQIAGTRRQRMVLSGEEDILALSGGNILLFLSICQLIWDYASQASDAETKEPDLPIRWEVQTVGIFRAGRNWLDRITSEYGRSQARYRLVQKLGEEFAEALLSDRKISNPGHNGVSLAIDELGAKPEIFDFLIEAVDYGNLVTSEHANRSDRRRRYKFYLHPLYCPVFRIPYQRIKEPIYLPLPKFEDWLADAGIIEKAGREKGTRAQGDPAAAPLLDLLDSRP
jgi:hypothetical protein